VKAQHFFSISRGSHLHERKKQKLVSFPSNLENDSGSGSERLGKHIFGAKTTKKGGKKPSKFSRFFLANFSVKRFLHSFLPSSFFWREKFLSVSALTIPTTIPEKCILDTFQNVSLSLTPKLFFSSEINNYFCSHLRFLVLCWTQ
jgi:hypothetical protein